VSGKGERELEGRAHLSSGRRPLLQARQDQAEGRCDRCFRTAEEAVAAGFRASVWFMCAAPMGFEKGYHCSSRQHHHLRALIKAEHSHTGALSCARPSGEFDATTTPAALNTAGRKLMEAKAELKRVQNENGAPKSA
jgi:hypothetical protein